MSKLPKVTNAPAPAGKSASTGKPAEAKSSWKDRFKNMLGNASDASKPTVEQVTEKSSFSKLKDNTKDTLNKLVSFFVKKEEDIDNLTKKSPPVKILKGIVKLLSETEIQRKLDYVQDKKIGKSEERDTEKKHREILKALTVRRKKPKSKPVTQKKKTEEKQPSQPTQTKKPSATKSKSSKNKTTTPKPVPKTTAPSTTNVTGASSWVSTATKVAAGGAVAAASTGALAMPKDERVVDAIKKASDLTGVSLPLMYSIAKQESGFDPNAAAKTSSARGLFQFIKGTWAGMVSNYGSKYPILKQRGPNDPEANALAGALYIKENSDILTKSGIPVNATTIYSAHFLGAGGAKTLLSLPADAIAAQVLPNAAASNVSIFYKKGDLSQPRTAQEVVQVLFEKVGKYEQRYAEVLQPQTGNQVVKTSTENRDMKTSLMDQSATSKVINNVNMSESQQQNKTTKVADDRSPFDRVKQG